MSVESTVRWHHWKMEGATDLRCGAGFMLSFLRGVLINGFTPKEASGITVAGGVATVTFGSAHKFFLHSVIEVTGATPAELNDVWRVTGVTSDTFTFACPGVPDGAATGTISVRVPPQVGWEEVFTGTNKAVFRNTHPVNAGRFLWVNDDFPNHCQIRAYESMTDIDTGTDPFPTIAQRAITHFTWRKRTTWYACDGTQMPYIFVGDAGGFHFLPNYFFNPPTTYRWHHNWLSFIDCLPVIPSDEWATLVAAENNDTSWPPNFMQSTAVAGKYTCRSRDGITNSRLTYSRGLGVDAANSLSGGYPWDGINGHFDLSPMGILNGNTAAWSFRAFVPGGYFAGVIPWGSAAPLQDHELAYYLTDPSGKTYLRFWVLNSSQVGGVGAIDIIGPWRANA